MLAPSGRTVADIKQTIDSSLKPEVLEVPGVMLSSTIENESAEAPSENVAAFIEGSDPALKDEVVVISSHYDHIGIDAGAEGDNINNGADDDGSGTVGVLEMAEAFMKAKQDGHGPRRSILFLNVTGEEKGLLGSQYFTDSDPLLPLDKIVTDLNIDMIGRYDPTHPTQSENYVYIIGSNLISQELHDINAKVNELTGTSLELDERFNSKDDPNQFYRRSDHWNFGKHSIPFIFFFTGTHDDYHGVDDEADKIEYDRMARITRLIFATAWQVANQDNPPVVSGEGFN
jgi:Zn-dependent M28 family amino/carboxypeptidase